MVTGDRLTITLNGGAPWGFRLQGGGNFPLEVAKIRKNSHSHRAGLREGDVILSINGYPSSGKSHQSAMDIVETANNEIVFEVVRPAGGQGASQPLDPQRPLRHVQQSSHEQGNVQSSTQTHSFVVKSGDGQTVTRRTSEHKITSYNGVGGVSPAVSYGSLGSGEHKSRSPARSPLIWQPPSQNTGNIRKSSSTLDISYGHRKTSPDVWQPRSVSPSPGSHPQRRASAQSGSLDRVSLRAAKRDKENVNPMSFISREQKKWEAAHQFDTVPKRDTYKPNNFKYAPPKMDDPNYPMFELPKKVEWTPPKINVPPKPIGGDKPKKWAPPVPPKPVTPSPSPIPFDHSTGISIHVKSHYPGMIRPPMPENLMPAPPPPPLPPSPGNNPKFNVVPIQSKFEPGHFSKLNHEMNGYDEPDPAGRPKHLHVFQPQVMFAPPDEDAGMLSPDRDAHSDISAHKKKMFSDSAFYDDATNRYPTIDEQMSMCKKIAQSLTSFANNRARGARMFAKRKRKANKWIHETRGYGSEFSSSAGDVADINDLDSELFNDEGGNKPLFSFRIPKVAGQVTAGEKMSLSKQEFERLRLVAPKVDHHGVSPNQCFSIAADLQKGGKNRGAKLFQKRQQRVEKFVIDDSNVLKSPTSTKLDFIVQNPQQPSAEKSPWVAAAQGDVNKAFSPHHTHSMPIQPLPRHNLTTDNHPKLLGGRNFNKKACGWQGSGPGGQQQSYYRESYDPSTGVTTKQWHQEQQSSQTQYSVSDPNQLEQYGNYNRRIKPFPEQEQQPERKQVEQGDYNRRIKAWPEQSQEPPQKTMEYGDYNRKIKAWPESGQGTLPKQTSQTSHSVQSSYYSLPRGFKPGGSNPKHVIQQQHHVYRQHQHEQIPVCDL